MKKIDFDKIDFLIKEKPISQAKQARRERHNFIFKVFCEVKRQNPSKSNTACMIHVAQQLSVGLSTIRNIVGEFEPHTC